VPAEERLASLVRALQSGGIYGGLTEALDEAERYHPPEVIEALFRGAVAREGGGGGPLRRDADFIPWPGQGKRSMGQRPFFLRFNTKDRDEREAVFRELCQKIRGGCFEKLEAGTKAVRFWLVERQAGAEPAVIRPESIRLKSDPIGPRL